MSNLLVLLFQFLETTYPNSSGFFAWLLAELQSLFPTPIPAPAAAKAAMLASKKAGSLPFTEAQLQTEVDNAFAALLTKLTARPFLTYMVTAVQTMTDALVLPAFWQFLVSQGIA
jgi:hypothetical protein